MVAALAQLTNELREPLHAELLELAVAFAEPTRTVDAPDWSAGLALPDAELTDWGEQLEDRWRELRPALDALLTTTRTDLEERARALLPAEQKAELAYQRGLFTARLKELDDRGGERGRERLRKELAKEETALSQLTFDPDHERETAERVRRLRQLLEGEEYRRIEARSARMQARIERERDQLLGDVLPRRYALARCALTPAAVALLVPSGASS